MLKKMIKFVSVRASQVASKSSNADTVSEDAKQEELNANLREFAEEAASVSDNDQSDW
jgi:F0F1-type ATP synthase membrane subunit b/b'